MPLQLEAEEKARLEHETSNRAESIDGDESSSEIQLGFWLGEMSRLKGVITHSRSWAFNVVEKVTKAMTLPNSIKAFGINLRTSYLKG